MRFLLVFAAVALLCQGSSAFASITYVDATTANTTLQNGTPLVLGSNYTSNSGQGAMDNLWHLRTGVGNGDSVWTADELSSGSEDVVPLVTTINFPQAGGYRIFAYIWDSEDVAEDWDVKVRIGSAGVYSKVQASEIEPANPARFSAAIVTNESPRRLMQIPVGVVVVQAGGTAQIFIDDDATVGSRCTWYDGVGYEKIFGALGEQIIAIDFNKTNVPAAPSQASFRIIGGSSTQNQNSTNIFKSVSAYGVRLSKASATPFDFRGANGDSTRTIPGGPTGLSFLVADFVGGRDGIINIGISNLASGTYLFRSYHLEPFNSSNFDFARGSSSITPNTLRANVAGLLEGIVQPTALGSVGLATNFISNTDIPTLAFPINADGSNVVTINLSTIYTNGVDRFIFLNGFEIFSTTP
ncbi:MAG: hypothetical protein ABIR24_02335 [Verrucomicrobiota bacterium]